MDELKAVVFSRDRAMQLDALLQSVASHVPELFAEVVVLYRATDESFAAGYELLKTVWPQLNFIQETAFRNDLLAVRGSERFIVFHTDDDVYFRPVGPFELRDDEVCFTLRLGLNTTYCYPLDLDEALRDAQVFDNRVSWEWSAQDDGTYRYPLSLNAHIFRAVEAHNWLERTEYSNPNELEASLRAVTPDIRPRMAAFAHSSVVSIPANVVNDTYANRHGAMYDVRDLNRRFLMGERIDLRSMTFDLIDACHVEIPYVFKRSLCPSGGTEPGA